MTLQAELLCSLGDSRSLHLFPLVDSFEEVQPWDWCPCSPDFLLLVWKELQLVVDVLDSGFITRDMDALKKTYTFLFSLQIKAGVTGILDRNEVQPKGKGGFVLRR